MTSDHTNIGGKAQSLHMQPTSRTAQFGADREAALELAYAASASQDIAMVQEAQGTEGDGLGSEDWCEPSGQG